MRSFMAYKELWLVFVSNHSARACLRARKIKPLSPLTKILNRVISGLWTRNEMESWINALLKSAFSLLFMLKHHFCDTSTIFVCRKSPRRIGDTSRRGSLVTLTRVAWRFTWLPIWLTVENCQSNRLESSLEDIAKLLEWNWQL